MSDKARFYLFTQNNSGGSFHRDENVDEYVIIQAYSAEHANSIAEDIGIYFHGVYKGRDCECCGDRWYCVNDDYDEVTDQPEIYGSTDISRHSHKIHYLEVENERISDNDNIDNRGVKTVVVWS